MSDIQSRIVVCALLLCAAGELHFVAGRHFAQSGGAAELLKWGLQPVLGKESFFTMKKQKQTLQLLAPHVLA
jgi:hypothetical protein